MKTLWMAVVLCVAAACGPSPIPDSTLSGTVGGSAFTAQGALASTDSFSEPGQRNILIAEVPLTCDDLFKSLDRSIIFTTDWTAGKQTELGLFDQTVTFVTGGSNNNIATDGRLEVVDAPMDKGTTGTLKLRAFAGADSVEGTVSVTVCNSNG
jgi:hypothetical protein